MTVPVALGCAIATVAVRATPRVDALLTVVVGAVVVGAVVVGAVVVGDVVLAATAASSMGPGAPVTARLLIRSPAVLMSRPVHAGRMGMAGRNRHRLILGRVQRRSRGSRASWINRRR